MNPADLLLLLASLLLATLSLAAHGPTLHGLGPAVILIAGGSLHLWLQWLRHRSWLRHRDSGLAPGTQHLALAASLGWSLSVVIALAWLLTSGKPLKP